MIDVETEGLSLALFEMMGLENCKWMWVWRSLAMYIGMQVES